MNKKILPLYNLPLPPPPKKKPGWLHACLSSLDVEAVVATLCKICPPEISTPHFTTNKAVELELHYRRKVFTLCLFCEIPVLRFIRFYARAHGTWAKWINRNISQKDEIRMLYAVLRTVNGDTVFNRWYYYLFIYHITTILRVFFSSRINWNYYYLRLNSGSRLRLHCQKIAGLEEFSCYSTFCW